MVFEFRFWRVFIGLLSHTGERNAWALVVGMLVSPDPENRSCSYSGLLRDQGSQTLDPKPYLNPNS